MLDRLRIVLLKRLNKATAELARLEPPSPQLDRVRALGNRLLQDGEYSKAELHYREALETAPNDTKTLVNLGFALKEQKRLVEARIYLKKAASTGNNDQLTHEIHYLLGQVAEEEGALEDASTSYAKALELKPDFELACRDLCRVLFLSNKLEAAQAVLNSGLTLNPEYADFHYYQGNLHVENLRTDLAAQSYSRALSLGANYAAAYSALGTAQYRLGDKEAALKNFQNAERLELGSVSQAHYESGYFYLRSGDPLNAIANFEVAINTNPDFLLAHSMLLFCLSFNPKGPPTYREAALRYGAQVHSKLSKLVPATKLPFSRGSRPLKIGFVSGDLKAHPVGFFLEGILREIDPKRLHTTAYSNTSNEDQHTERLRAQFTEWHDIKHIDDAVVAQTVRDHQIDILVDLSGHTGQTRLPLFARRPAPVQVAWLGYFASTGLSDIDYILVDPSCIPEHSTEFFSEKAWYLPDTRLCMTPPVTRHPIAVSPLPAQANGFITFGSFQSQTKIGSPVLASWSRVLTAMPNSRLRLQVPQVDIPAFRESLLQRLFHAGIDPSRVVLLPGVHWEEYLAAYHQVDILLDTFPYPGGTTTTEALWMGVPTVTLTGDTMLSRQGASMLTCVGLTDWIADNEDEYVAKAAQFARDVPALARLRGELRDRALRSPLFDTPRFARNLQHCFEDMFLGLQALPSVPSSAELPAR